MTTVQQHQEPDKGDSPLGVVPHSIRGFLHRHQQVLPATEAFYNCTACSPLVLQRYAESGYTFLLEVFNNPDSLEQVSGLADLHKDIASVEVIEFQCLIDTNNFKLLISRIGTIRKNRKDR